MGMLLDFAVSRRVEGFSNLVKAEDTGPDSVIPITSCDPGGVTGPLGTTTAKDCGSCPASSLPSFSPRGLGQAQLQVHSLLCGPEPHCLSPMGMGPDGGRGAGTHGLGCWQAVVRFFVL